MGSLQGDHIQSTDSCLADGTYHALFLGTFHQSLLFDSVDLCWYESTLQVTCGFVLVCCQICSFFDQQSSENNALGVLCNGIVANLHNLLTTVAGQKQMWSTDINISLSYANLSFKSGNTLRSIKASFRGTLLLSKLCLNTTIFLPDST